MVDATAQFSMAREAPSADAGTAAREAAKSPVLSLADYCALASRVAVAPAQSPAWVSAWTASGGMDTVIVLAGPDAGPRVALPLEIVRKGPFRVARFMSGSHANGNFPAVEPGPSTLQLADIVAAIRTARPDVDVVHLERICQNLGDATTPLSALPRTESPNIALAVCLEGGFEALLDRASGKRKRKKHRSQSRKFEAAGGFRRLEAETPEDVARTLALFYEMKVERFRKLGVPDVFATQGVKDFFARLFTEALSASPKPFVLHSLEVGGKIRAITGSSLSGDRLICEFGAIVEDELAFASPGEFLSFLNIREACADGFDIYDFSVGDEPYKRLWCNIETRHFDLTIPVSAKGRLLAAVLDAQVRAKRAIKGNRMIWALAKRLRRKSVAAAPAAADDE
jgi:CelD/BcsL family acetyltransferase involved in cellulose biosynthesis